MKKFPILSKIKSLNDSLTLAIYSLIDITNPTISFNANGIGVVPLRAGYWLLTASVSNGEALGVSYSFHNQYILKNTNYQNANLSVYLTWAKIPAP